MFRDSELMVLLRNPFHNFVFFHFESRVVLPFVAVVILPQNGSSNLRVAVVDDGGGGEQFATKALCKPDNLSLTFPFLSFSFFSKALLAPKKGRKQPNGKPQALIIGGKPTKPPKIGTPRSVSS